MSSHSGEGPSETVSLSHCRPTKPNVQVTCTLLPPCPEAFSLNTTYDRTFYMMKSLHSLGSLPPPPFQHAMLVLGVSPPDAQPELGPQHAAATEGTSTLQATRQAGPHAEGNETATSPPLPAHVFVYVKSVQPPPFGPEHAVEVRIWSPHAERPECSFKPLPSHLGPPCPCSTHVRQIGLDQNAVVATRRASIRPPSPAAVVQPAQSPTLGVHHATGSSGYG